MSNAGAFAQGLIAGGNLGLSIQKARLNRKLSLQEEKRAQEAHDLDLEISKDENRRADAKERRDEETHRIEAWGSRLANLEKLRALRREERLRMYRAIGMAGDMLAGQEDFSGPRVVEAISGVLNPILAKDAPKGVTREVDDIHPVGENAFAVTVTGKDKDGKPRKGPLTERGSTDPDDPVVVLPGQEFVRQFGILAEALGLPVDKPESWRDMAKVMAAAEGEVEEEKGGKGGGSGSIKSTEKERMIARYMYEHPGATWEDAAKAVVAITSSKTPEDLALDFTKQEMELYSSDPSRAIQGEFDFQKTYEKYLKQIRAVRKNQNNLDGAGTLTDL